MSSLDPGSTKRTAGARKEEARRRRRKCSHHIAAVHMERALLGKHVNAYGATI